MNQFAVELHVSRYAAPESALFGYLQELRGGYWHDGANVVHQNTDRADGSAQDNNRRMEAGQLLGNIEKTVQTNNWNGSSSEIQEARQSGRHTRWRGESRHGHDFPRGFRRESTT